MRGPPGRVLLRRALTAGLWAAILLVLSASPVEAQAWRTRADPPSPNYVPLFLTWNANKGGLAWDPKAPTADNGGPAAGDPTVATAQYIADGTVNFATGTNVLMPGPDEFSSVGAPADLFVNASRLIQVNLYLKGGDTCDPPYASIALDVELYAGDTLVAGGLSQMSDQVDPGQGAPPATGYGTCSFRLQSETNEIAAGAVLKLRVIHWKQNGPFTYGMAEDHRSVVLIPVFSPAESVFRVPELATVSPGPQAGPGAAPGLAALALVGGRWVRRVRGSFLAACLVAVAFSGCLGSGTGPALSADVGGSSRSGLTDGNATLAGLGNATLGAVIGEVKDAAGYPVPDVHVSLVGTDNFTRTDGAGTFRFAFIAPGAYGLRFEHGRFKTYQSEVVVRADRITKTLVVLVAREAVSDALPHVHDYWDGRSQITLLNDLDVGSLVCRGPGHDPLDLYFPTNIEARHCRGGTFRIPLNVERQDESLILPGTNRVEVTITWPTAALGNQELRRVGLFVRDNQDPGYTVKNTFGDEEFYENETILYPRGSGQAMSLASSFEMTDAGHQRGSTWTFGLFIDETQLTRTSRARAASLVVPEPSSGDVVIWGLNGHPDAVYGPFSVSLTIHRGVVGPEPGHKDFWKGADSLTLIQNKPPNDEVCFVEHSRAGASSLDCYNVWRPPSLIPPETTWIEVVHQASKRYNDKPVAFKPGSLPPETPIASYRDFEVETKDGLKRTYRHVLKEDEADPFYAKRSGWFFHYQEPIEDSRDAGAYAQYLLDYYLIEEWSHGLTIVAHRDTPPA